MPLEREWCVFLFLEQITLAKLVRTREKDPYQLLGVISHIFCITIRYIYNETNVSVGIKCDNQTAISYVNNLGGMDMDSLAKDIWK